MSHIAIDARELRTSTGRYIERVLHYLQQIESDHRYTVLLKPADMDGWEPTNPAFSTLACPYKEFTFGEQLGFEQQLARVGADLVHFGMTQQPILYRGKALTTIHDLTTLRFTNPDKKRTSFWIKQQVYKGVVKIVAKKSAAIITPSEFVKSDLIAYTGVSPDKVSVTPEAADPIAAPPTPLPDLQNKQFIMYIGRPTPHKNLERLIAAFVELKGQYPALLLVLAGKQDANYRRIEQSVLHEHRQSIIFTGFVSDSELRWLYENCNAYIFPSLSEGFGLPGLEAMKHGAPVVSSDATCLPEVYGDAAQYFDPTSIEAMAGAISEVLGSPALQHKLTAAGTAQAKHFSWQRTAEQTLEVYNRLLT